MLSSRLCALSHTQLCRVWILPLVWREVKCCGLVEKSREAQRSKKELLEMSPNYPLQLNIPEYGVPAAQEQGALERDERSCEQVHLCSLKSRRSSCGACLGFQPGQASPPSISGIYLTSVTQVPRRQGARDRVRPYSLQTGRTGPGEQVVSPARWWLPGDSMSPGLHRCPEMAPRAGQSGDRSPGVGEV